MMTPEEPPTDPVIIKQHIAVRREAVKIMLSEITMLSDRLRHTVGPVEWLKYQAQEVKGDPIMGESEENQDNWMDQGGWTQKDYLDKDQEWRDYLERGKS